MKKLTALGVNYKKVFFIVMLVLVVLNSLLKSIYDSDLDHEIYFAQRLLHGNLLWTEEFHDKLPFLPFLLIIPAFFKSILICKLFFLSVILIITFFSINSLKKILCIGDNKYIIDVSFCFYFFLLYISYGSILTINCLSVSFFFGFFVALMRSLFVKKRCDFVYLWGLGSFFAAMAISVRPYYFVPVGFTLCCSYILIPEIEKGWLQRSLNAFKGIGCWIFGIGLFGFVCNIVPYILIGKISAFIDGMIVLTSPINPVVGWHSFFSQSKKYPDIVFWISWMLMFLFMMVGVCRRGKQKFSLIKKIFFISFASFIALLLSIVSQHWWAHYIQLFVGNYCICLCMFLLYFNSKNFYKNYIRAAVSVSYILLGVILCLSLNHNIHIRLGEKIAIPVWESEESDWEAKMILSFFDRIHPHQRPSFLMPEDMKGHWLLDEPRYHFEHASHIKAIYTGWWQKVTYKSRYFFIDRNAEEFCKRLNQSGPDFIFVSQDYYITQCLLDKNSSYYKVDHLAGRGRVFFVYQRRSYKTQ